MDYSTDMSGKVALVTGGGTGIGLIIAKAFAGKGAKVYIAGRRFKILCAAAQSIVGVSGSIVPIQMDITDKESIQNVVEEINRADKKLDVLVNNAAIVGPSTPFILNPSSPERQSTSTYGKALFDSQTPDEWAEVAKTNVAAFFFVTVAFLGLLEASTNGMEQGMASVINVTSAASLMNVPYGPWAYIGLKSAASHISRVLALDFATKGIPIRVNAIAPGLFESQMTPSGIQLEQFARTGWPDYRPIPCKRPGQGQEMAALALYLSSPTSTYTNGQEIAIDGGMTLINP